MARIRLEPGLYGWDYIIRNTETEEAILIETDWDYPGVASTFGWTPCECGFTDGTIDCEHKTASEMIQEAQEWLDAHLYEEAEDPGYFS